MSIPKPEEEVNDPPRPSEWTAREGETIAFILGLALGVGLALWIARRWEPGDGSRGRAAPVSGEPGIPHLPEAPARYEQDTQPVDGEAAIHPPPGTELIQRSQLQG